MSYYYKHGYNFTFHSMYRIKERLNMKKLEDWEAKEACIKLIDESKSNFQTNKHIYIQAGSKELFFVINKLSKVVLTVTPISVTKQLWLIENE